MTQRCLLVVVDQMGVPCDPDVEEGFWDLKDTTNGACGDVYSRPPETVQHGLFWNTFAGSDTCIQPRYIDALRHVSLGSASDVSHTTDLPNVEWLRNRVILMVKSLSACGPFLDDSRM
jgi:hypothetical protein